MHRISVLDCHPGSGKTTWAIQYINKLPYDTRVIYITPLLKECERIRDECPQKHFCLPESIQGVKNKSDDFLRFLDRGYNIATSHVLFSSITDEMVEKIRIKNYILILDEVMDVVSRINIYDEKAKLDKKKLSDEDRDYLMKQDIKSMLTKGIIEVNNDYSVRWCSDEVKLGFYNRIKTLADRELLYLIEDELLIWTFPIEIFREGIFEQIFILTYMFDCQIQAYYYKFFGLEYKKYYVDNVGFVKKQYEIFQLDDMKHDYEWKNRIRQLIHICDNQKINKIGSYYQDALGRTMSYALSKNWYKNASNETLKILNQNIDNYLKNITKSKAIQRMWTCFKIDVKTIFKSNKELSKKYWVPLTCRATNDYGNKNVLVYPINRYLNPFYDKFFSKKGITINEDQYALSEFIQWLFRSAIRNDKEIWIYVPSQRMRELLESWVNKGDKNEY